MADLTRRQASHNTVAEKPTSRGDQKPIDIMKEIATGTVASTDPLSDTENCLRTLPLSVKSSVVREEFFAPKPQCSTEMTLFGGNRVLKVKLMTRAHPLTESDARVLFDSAASARGSVAGGMGRIYPAGRLGVGTMPRPATLNPQGRLAKAIW